MIGGKRALDAAFDKIKAAVDQTNLEIIGKELYGKDCTYQTVESFAGCRFIRKQIWYLE